MTALTLVAGYAQGVGLAWPAPLSSNGGVSLVAAILVLPAAFLGGPVDGDRAGVLFAMVALLTAIAATIWIWGIARPEEGSSQGRQENGLMLQEGRLSFTLVGLSTFLLQAGSFAIAGPWLDDVALGHVRGAERLAVVISFPVLAIQPFIVSRIVRYVRGRQAYGARRGAALLVRRADASGISTAD